MITNKNPIAEATEHLQINAKITAWMGEPGNYTESLDAMAKAEAKLSKEPKLAWSYTDKITHLVAAGKLGDPYNGFHFDTLTTPSHVRAMLLVEALNEMNENRPLNDID